MHMRYLSAIAALLDLITPLSTVATPKMLQKHDGAGQFAAFLAQ